MIPVKMNDLAALKTQLQKDKPLFCDTETNFLRKSIRLVQCYQEGWPEVLMFDIRDVLLREVYEAIKDSWIVFHNAAFDGACFSEDLDLKTAPFKNFDDALILCKQEFPTHGVFSLDEMFKLVHGFDVYEQYGKKKDLQKSFLTTKKVDMSKEDLTEVQIQYAAADVWYFPKFWDAVKSHRDEEFYLLDKEFMLNMFVWQRRGVPVKQQEIERLASGARARAAELQNKLGGINVNSPKQVKECLGCASSSRETLIDLASSGNKKAGLVHRARKEFKTLNFLKRYDHPAVRSFFSVTTSSGRAKASGVDFETPSDQVGFDNLLQIPRHLKELFGFAKDQGKWLAYCDFSQLEVRSACALTGDIALENALRSGKDLHAATASLMFPGLTYEAAKEDKFKRTIAKTCNFTLLYCGNATSLLRSLNSFKLSLDDDDDDDDDDDGALMTLSEAEMYRTKWKSAYKQINAWHAAASRTWKDRPPFLLTEDGRKYAYAQFAEIVGVHNQALGASAAKAAVNILHRRNPEVKMIHFMHDAIYAVADSLEEARLAGKAIGEAMLMGWFEQIASTKIPSLPMPLEVAVGKDFKDVDSSSAELVWQTKGEIEDYEKILAEKKEGSVFETSSEKEVTKPIKETIVPPRLKNRHIIVDADTVFYVAAYLNEDNTLADCVTSVKEWCRNVREQFLPKSITLFLTGSSNFRYLICPEYKQNRKGKPRPKHLDDLKKYATKNFKNVVCDERWEADDLVAESKRENPRRLIFAVDKDVLNALPGEHWDYHKRTVVKTDPRNARMWPFYQALVGDSADGIPGVRGIGPVKAKKLLSPKMGVKKLWETTKKAYENNGLTEEDAVRTMRLVLVTQKRGDDFALFNPGRLRELQELRVFWSD